MANTTKPKTGKVGDLFRLPADPASVVLPDGSEITVVGGLYVLTDEGLHTSGEAEITATKRGK